MKLYCKTLATGMLLLLLANACKKAAHEQTPANSSASNLPEAVLEEAVTPLNRPIAVPSAGRQGLRDANSAPMPIILVHGLGGFGPGELLGFNYWGGIDNIPNTLLTMVFLRMPRL
ncbi:hypothetical protein [Paraflavitalea speifideaquila]|uniref:hypothetical protein n=1 Tax=Paraflavitalea speifideaquila TaxID=3076558 RepID=UPI0028E6236D|nr:hypothetical protein [Paraflavitalea speifideiaquila]